MSIYRTQDINIEDRPLRLEYYRNFINGSINEAQEIYENNPSLQGKCVNAELLNQLIDGIMVHENRVDNEIPQFLSNEYNRYQLNIDDLVYMNEWDANTQYEVNNFVLQNEYIYFCYLKPPVGNQPTDTNYWIELNTQGEEGYPSLGIKFRGYWSSVDEYVEYNAVTYQNKIYVAKSANTNIIPTNTTYWYEAITTEPRMIFVSPTEPSDMAIGDIWFKVSQ